LGGGGEVVVRSTGYQNMHEIVVLGAKSEKQNVLLRQNMGKTFVNPHIPTHKIFPFPQILHHPTKPFTPQ